MQEHNPGRHYSLYTVAQINMAAVTSCSRTKNSQVRGHPQLS